MFTAELKRIIKNKLFKVNYIAFIIIIISLLALTFFQGKAQDKIAIFVIDNDKSVESTQYIERLSKAELIKVVQTGNAKNLLQRNMVNAILEIPKDFFKNFKEKLEFTTKSYDITSPAIIDNVAEAFIADIGRYKLSQKVKYTFDESYIKKAIADYNKKQNENEFNLDIDIKTSEKYTGIIGEYREKAINKSKTFLMYSIIFLAILLVISLNMTSILKNKFINKLTLSKIGFIRYYLNNSLANLTIITSVLLPITIICAVRIKLTLLSLLYLFLVELISIYLLTQIIQLIFTLIKRDNYSFAISLFLIIISGIIGGAFFNIDMMPKALLSIAKYSNFYTINTAYYSAISGKYIILPTIISIVITLLISITTCKQLTKKLASKN